jgi:hypothetical protein
MCHQNILLIIKHLLSSHSHLSNNISNAMTNSQTTSIEYCLKILSKVRGRIISINNKTQKKHEIKNNTNSNLV